MSDQDFFFDEEESAEEKKPAKKSDSDSAKKSAPAKKAPKSCSSSSAADVPFLERTVTMTIAMLMAVVTLLVGVIVGIIIPTDGGVPAPTATSGMEAGGSAPQLSPEQLDSGMPEGHPDIGEMGGGEAMPEGMGDGSMEATELAE